MVSGEDVANVVADFSDYNYGAFGEFHEVAAIPARSGLGFLATGADRVFQFFIGNASLLLSDLCMAGYLDFVSPGK